MHKSAFWQTLIVLGMVWPASPAAAVTASRSSGPAASPEAGAQSSGRRHHEREEPATTHTAVREQLWNHPVPLFIEVRADIAVDKVLLFYRSPAETDFQQVEMERWATGGYFAEIPCSMIQPPRWEYYITVVDGSGQEVGTAGTAERPNRIVMSDDVDEPPARPDGTSVAACNEDGTAPGTVVQSSPDLICGGNTDRACAIDEDCPEEQVCIDGCCGTPSVAEASARYRPVGLFVRLGGGVGGGFVSGTVTEPDWEDPLTHAVRPGPDGTAQTGELGVAMPLAGAIVRLEFGYHIVRQFSLSVLGRMSFPFGDEVPWLAELRGTYWFRFGGGHRVGVFLGGGVGRMAHRLDSVSFKQTNGNASNGLTTCPDGTPERCKTFSPFWWSSGLGTIGFGAEYVFMIVRWFGLAGELAFNPMFPDFSFNIDFDLGVFFAF
jgi:hypothetical protein